MLSFFGDGTLTVPDSSVIYQTPSHRCAMTPPEGLQKSLTTYGGKNLYGEPLFRVSWGGSRHELAYSRSTQRYEHRPKYFNRKNRWIVEAWHPTAFGEAEWYRMSSADIDGRTVALLGPYPVRGDYEYLWHASTPHKIDCDVEVQVKGGDGGCICGGGNYLQLTPRVCEVLLDMVKLTKNTSAFDRRNFFFEQEEKRKLDFDRIATDAIDDAGSPFGGNYFVPQFGGNVLRESKLV